MEREFVSFTIAGEFVPGTTDLQVFKLCYDFNQLADAETLTGLNLNAAYLGGEITVNQFRGILYAFMKTAHPAVTLKECGGLMATREGRTKCFEAAGKVLAGEIKEPEEEPELAAANA